MSTTNLTKILITLVRTTYRRLPDLHHSLHRPSGTKFYKRHILPNSPFVLRSVETRLHCTRDNYRPLNAIFQLHLVLRHELESLEQVQVKDLLWTSE